MLPDGMTRVDESIHLGVVMGILSKLYTMAKLMQSILLGYGVEVCCHLPVLHVWIY